MNSTQKPTLAEIKTSINTIKTIIKNIQLKGINTPADKEDYFWKNHPDMMNRFTFLISQLCSNNDNQMLDIMIKQLEENSFENLCTVIEDVKNCMLSLCQKNQTKRDEIETCLDVAFLKNVLNVGIAQKQVKCLLKYCLTFLREYGQPCYDSEMDELTKTTDLLYTSELTNTIELLVNIIREIASRINVLIEVVHEFERS